MNTEDIEHLAKLARIEVSHDEAAALAVDFTSILNYVSEINAITGMAAPEKKVGPVHNVFRDDVISHEPGAYTDAILKNAPLRDGQYIKVKKILENKK